VRGPQFPAFASSAEATLRVGQPRRWRAQPGRSLRPRAKMKALLSIEQKKSINDAV
jgi:hypothetical protein